DRIAGLRHEHDDGGIRGRGDVELGLADANGLDEYPIEAEGVHNVGDFPGGERESADPAATGHGPYEDALVERDLVHPDAVAEQRAAGERRGRVDGDDGDGLAARTIVRDERGDECRLP